MSFFVQRPCKPQRVMLILAKVTHSRSAESFSLLIGIATSSDPLVSTEMSLKTWFCAVTVLTDKIYKR